MALEGANTRQNLQYLPSIFEITAAETLDNLIHPALLKISDYVNACLSTKSSFAKYCMHERVSLCISWVVQYFYLIKRGASFGESFYSLQRVTSNGLVLNSGKRQKIFLSSLALVLLPYLERKLKRKAENRDITRYEAYFLKALHAYKTIGGIHMLLYMTKHTKSHSLLLKLLGLNLRYPLAQLEYDKASYVLLKLLEIMVFFLQFLQWWYFNNNNTNKNIGKGLKNPKPPKENEKQTIQKGECPICLMNIINPTACGISGYVYCWKCIMNHMRKYGTCPITGYSITLDDLIGICDSS